MTLKQSSPQSHMSCMVTVVLQRLRLRERGLRAFGLVKSRFRADIITHEGPYSGPTQDSIKGAISGSCQSPYMEFMSFWPTRYSERSSYGYGI